MSKTILIVDDVSLNIDLLTAILQDKYSIMAAVSGESALKILDRRKPDLVLLDVSMPGIDGFDVLKIMKERNDLANIPVIFVTGEHDTQAETTGLELGAVDYIKKPYSPAVVEAKVRNHLELKSYRDNLEQSVQERTKELEERTKQLDASREAIIMGMSLMSEVHDSVTGNHIERIKTFTEILARKMAELYPDLITEYEVGQIALFSPLHDVGKVGVPDGILKKVGTLVPEEFDIMKTHTVNAANLLRKTELFFKDGKDAGLDIAIGIAESHHEKYNGEGYPHGLKGEEIPLAARIVAVADVYDALRSERPYKKAYSHEEAVDIILSGDGRTMPEHFDPRVLEAFKLVHEEFKQVREM